MATWKAAARWEAKLDQAATGGLIAAAQIVYNAVKRGLKGGYTTGDYVTGNVLNSVTLSAVAKEGSALVIRVGTNVKYALFWELGWTPSAIHEIAGLAGAEVAAPLYRKEVWRPALIDTRSQQAEAFRRVFGRILKAETGSVTDTLATLGPGELEADAGLAESEATSTARRASLPKRRRRRKKR